MRTICLGFFLVSVLGMLGSGQPVLSVYRVVIDAGHGGDDTGGIGLYGLSEKSTVLQIAHLIVIEATSFSNIKIILTRVDDRYIASAERLAVVSNADLFISLHTDFARDPRARGVTALVPTYTGLASQTLAMILCKRVAVETKTLNRGVKAAPLWLRRLPVPAVQLDVGFVTNPSEARRLAQLSYQTHIALAILEGVQEFINLARIQ